MIGFSNTRYVDGDAIWLVRAYPWLVASFLVASVYLLV